MKPLFAVAAVACLAGAIALACSAGDGATPVCTDTVDPVTGATIDAGSCFTPPGDARFTDDVNSTDDATDDAQSADGG